MSGLLSFFKSIKYTEAGLGVIVLACVLTIDMIPNGPLRAGRDWLFDTYQVLYPARHDTSPVVVVEIDDQSIRNIGPWPWPRDKLAVLVENAQAASAVGLDILLSERDRLSPQYLLETLHVETPRIRQSLLALPDPDTALAAALRQAPSVLAMTSDGEEGSDPRSPVTTTPVRERGAFDPGLLPQSGRPSWPLRVLADAAHGIGTVSAPRGASGEIDRLPLVVRAGGSLLPSFALRLLAVAQGADTLVLNAGLNGAKSVSVDQLIIETDAAGEVRPHFSGEGRLVKIPAQRLMDRSVDPALLRGRIVVIGVTARGVGETFRTPLGSQESSPAIQAELILSALSGDVLSRPRWAVTGEFIAAIGTGLVTILLLPSVRYRNYLAIFGGFIVLLIGGSVLLLRAAGLLIDCLLPLSCLFATGFVSASCRIRTEAAMRRQREAELAVASIRQSAQRREAELQSEAETLRQSLTLAVDAARLGVWDADLLRGTWRHSPQHDALLGLQDPPPVWSPALLLDRVVAEDRSTVQRHLTAAEISGSLQLECRITWPDGSVRHIHVLGRLWRDAQGTLSRAAGVLADVTQQRELEQRLRQSEKMQAIGLLAGGVAHNFNNLLTVVLGSLDMAQGRLDPSTKTRVLISRAILSARKCADIARQLLAFARLQPLQPKPVDPGSLLREIHQVLGAAIPDRISLQLDVTTPLGEIKIDPVEFELALLNLATNACDAMPGGGRLEINATTRILRNARLGLDGCYLEVTVRDHGQGIAPEQLSKVFEPFFTTKELGLGTGLGLSQVHGFVHQSGGAVDIESIPRRGTCVRLYLPSSQPGAQSLQSAAAEMSR